MMPITRNWDFGKIEHHAEAIDEFDVEGSFLVACQP